MRVVLKFASTAALIAAAACASGPRDASMTGQYLSGRYAASSNSVDAAAEAFADGSAIAPREPEFLKGALFFHLAAGDIDEASTFAREILAVEAAQKAAGASKAAAPGAPVEVAPAEVTQGADASLARITLAAQSMKGGRLEEARAQLKGEMESPFLESIAFLMDVWIEKGLDGPDAALAQLNNPATDIFDGFNVMHKALLADEAGRVEDARAYYQAAVVGLGGPVAREAYGAFLERSADKAAARSYYELLAAEGGAWRPAAEKAYRRLERGAPSKAYSKTTPAEGAAIAFFSVGGAFVEHAAEERARMVRAGFNVGTPRFDLPLALARIALYLDPGRTEARRLIAWILDGYGDFDGARVVLAPVPTTSPHYAQAQIDIAGGLVAAEKSAEAGDVLRAAIVRDPEAIDLKWMLGNLYAGEGRHARAVDAFSDVIDETAKKPEAAAWRYYIARGGSLLELDRWDEAEADLKRAVEIAPEEPTALNYLGYSWAERGVNLEEAFKLIEKAVDLQPNSGAIVDSLGWAHYQLGRYDEAVGHLEKAVSLEPGDPTITDHLGDVYWRLGRETEARFQWRRALQLDPSEKLKAPLLKKIDGGLDAKG